MSEPRTVAVVGAGLAGGKTVEALRAEGFDGRIILFGDELHRPYERPPLSKGYLQGNDARGSCSSTRRAGTPSTTSTCGSAWRSPGWTGTPTSSMTPDGEPVRYDRLVLATGATPRRLRVPGADLPGVHYLRTLDDSDALRAAFRPGGDVVVIGAGWIGLEMAAAARGAGATVTVLETRRAAAAAACSVRRWAGVRRPAPGARRRPAARGDRLRPSAGARRP